MSIARAIEQKPSRIFIGTPCRFLLGDIFNFLDDFRELLVLVTRIGVVCVAFQQLSEEPRTMVHKDTEGISFIGCVLNGIY